MVSAIIANLYMEYLEQKALSTATPPRFWQRFMDDTFVIHKEVNNKWDFLQHINSVDPTIRLTVKDNKRMVPSPSWTPLSNLRLMVAYPLLCTGNLYIQTSTYSGIAIITSQLNSGSSIPSPIGPKQCAAVLCCSNKKWTTLERFSLNANILNGLWTR